MAFPNPNNTNTQKLRRKWLINNGPKPDGGTQPFFHCTHTCASIANVGGKEENFGRWFSFCTKYQQSCRAFRWLMPVLSSDIRKELQRRMERDITQGKASHMKTRTKMAPSDGVPVTVVLYYVDSGPPLQFPGRGRVLNETVFFNWRTQKMPEDCAVPENPPLVEMHRGGAIWSRPGVFNRPISIPLSRLGTYKVVARVPGVIKCSGLEALSCHPSLIGIQPSQGKHRITPPSSPLATKRRKIYPEIIDIESSSDESHIVDNTDPNLKMGGIIVLTDSDDEEDKQESQDIIEIY